jgi:hypothetical protein
LRFCAASLDGRSCARHADLGDSQSTHSGPDGYDIASDVALRLFQAVYVSLKPIVDKFVEAVCGDTGQVSLGQANVRTGKVGTPAMRLPVKRGADIPPACRRCFKRLRLTVRRGMAVIRAIRRCFHFYAIPADIMVINIKPITPR